MTEQENDPPLSHEQAELVMQLSETELKEIDEALLSNIVPQWRKVARVVGTTMNDIVNRVKGIPDIFYANRVIKLVENGNIESQGNLKRMQFSEVRKISE